ncbi:alpha/beta fold hydrolase [Nonomuraea mesophila]|uniref:Alpha/beta fold hydrolase n=1 Tax=Nonomuraea mesophila TaxID=2530382 RepID=A0A4V2ZAF2_9ACTN|nr:alpha/beta fold hydrolase [Nonomuraea mesophila]TDE52779.1 alpha/beta fold hydrolase [Nonomuraea mesophila]
MPQPTFVFVHGNYASAQYWAWTAQELTLRGHRALAVDLPGHGSDAHIPVSYLTQDLEAFATEPSPTAAITADDHVAHVEDVVRRAHAHGPVILAGHASAGVVLSLVANRVPDLLARLVYVSAFCCTDLPSMSAYTPGAIETEEHRVFGELVDLREMIERLGVIRINWAGDDPGQHAAFKALNAHTASDAEVRALRNQLQPDEPAGFVVTDARGNPGTWGRVPRTYIRFAQNRFLPPELQDRWIAEADRLTPGNTFDVHTVNVPHFAPRSQEVVDILHDLAARRS